MMRYHSCSQCWVGPVILKVYHEGVEIKELMIIFIVRRPETRERERENELQTDVRSDTNLPHMSAAALSTHQRNRLQDR